MKILIVTALVYQVLGEDNVADRQKLLKDLMKDYEKAIEPDNTPLKFSLTYLCGDYDTNTKVLTSKVWESLSWKDTRLAWEPSKYGDVGMLRIPDKDIWTPDMKLYDGVEVAEERSEVNTVVMQDGTVIWIPIATYKTRCIPEEDGDLDCKFKIGSWAYNAERLALEASDPAIDVSHYESTCPYTLSQQSLTVESKTYPCCPGESYASANVELKLSPSQ